MSPRASAFAAAMLCASTALSQQVRARARLGRFGPLELTVCPGDPPAEAWRRRIREEFDDRTVNLYEPSAETAAIHPDLRVVLRAARCAEGGSVYELALLDGRGELVQSTMVSMAGVARDDRPQVAALRVAEAFRTHRTALVGADPVDRVIDLSPPPTEAPNVLGVEAGGGVRWVPSSSVGLTDLHVGVTVRPDASSRLRGRLELGGAPGWQSSSRNARPIRVWIAPALTLAAWRSARAELAVGARVELATTGMDGRWFPTLIVGATVEGQRRVSERAWLWLRLDVGGYAVGAQASEAGVVYNLTEGFTAALSGGFRVDL